MISFKEFISESINDRGIFKAMFVVGLPGSGKSYTVNRLKGTVSPVIVNTDKAAEFLSRKWGKQIDSTSWADFRDKSHHITKTQLFNYINGMLPLFIDGTSNDVSNLLHRIGILESLGYDVGVIFVNTDLETALQRTQDRAKEIGRHVDADFVRQVHKTNEENKRYLQSKVSFFREIQNNSTAISDKTIGDAFTKVQGFFAAPISNPIGKRNVEKLKADQQKYMTPDLVNPEVLNKKIDGWYKS